MKLPILFFVVSKIVVALADKWTTESTVTELITDDGDLLETDIFCDAPPDIERTQKIHLGSKNPVGTLVNYVCDFGYISRGPARFQSVCEYNSTSKKASWINPNVVCIPRSCGDPGFVPNARRIGSLFTFPNKVEFHCEEGYKLQGSETRYCAASGKWTGKLPACESIFCPAPAHPENGMARYNSLEYGSELHYQCNKGFVLSDGRMRLCTENGSWSGSDPDCTEISCKSPENPLHGSVTLVGEPKVDGIALFSCNEGTTLIGSSASKCLSTGQWTFDPPKCLNLCVITNIPDGRIGHYEKKYSRWRRYYQQFVQYQVGMTVEHGGNVTLVCDEGFFATEKSETSDKNPETSAMMICNDGKWSKELQCKSGSCNGDAPPIQHGYPVVSKRTHGHVIYYRCNSSYVKSKIGHVECIFGKWEGFTPICADSRCYTSQLNEPGLIKPNLRFINNNRNIVINCMQGYRKVAKRWSKISCDKGHWKVPKDTCKEESCLENPPGILHGNPNITSQEPNSEVDYECNEGFILVGKSSVRCRAGKWTGEPPNCVDEAIHSDSTSSKAANGGTEQPVHSNKVSKEEDCFCVYDHEDSELEVSLRGEKLRTGAHVKKGDSVVLSCKSRLVLVWANGLRVYNSVNMSCSVCQNWESKDLPFCEDSKIGDSYIVLNSDSKLIPGGTVEVHLRKKLVLYCINFDLQYPSWDLNPDGNIEYYSNGVDRNVIYSTQLTITEVRLESAGDYQCSVKNAYRIPYTPTKLHLKVTENVTSCPKIDDVHSLDITYTKGVQVNSSANFNCKNIKQKISGPRRRICLSNGEWSDYNPSCVDITCPQFVTTPGLQVTYTEGEKVGSFATFRCHVPATIKGSSISLCRYNGNWSDSQPICEEPVRKCPLIEEREIFNIVYSNKQEINSKAYFMCKDSNQKIEGPQTRTCKQNGKWSGTDPMCVAPGCWIADLADSLPEHVVPKLEDVEELLPVGTELGLLCDEEKILVGSTKATCDTLGKWQYGTPQCEIGCYLNIDDTTSQIIIEPAKSSYRLGETVVFSCPLGYSLMSDVVRLMCLGSNSWSDSVPECERDRRITNDE